MHPHRVLADTAASFHAHCLCCRSLLRACSAVPWRWPRGPPLGAHRCLQRAVADGGGPCSTLSLTMRMRCPSKSSRNGWTCILTAGSTCLQVTIDKDHTLTVEGERKQEHEEDDEGVRRIERSYGVFVRRFQVCVGAMRGLVTCCFRTPQLRSCNCSKGVYHHCSDAVSRWAAWAVKGQLV